MTYVFLLICQSAHLTIVTAPKRHAPASSGIDDEVESEESDSNDEVRGMTCYFFVVNAY